MSDFSHLDDSGDARMVDIGDKEVTERRATARGWVHMSSETLERLQDGNLDKGDVSQVARIAGIMGAKETPDLIPLCHQIPIDDIDLEFAPAPEEGALEIVARGSCHAKTGLEMEVLTAVSVAALTVYDMCKSVDSTMHIGDVHLVDKTGGQSGDFEHPDPPGPEGELDEAPGEE